LARDETVIAVVAGLVDVEEGDDVAFLYGVALDVSDPAPRRFDDADGHVAGDNREWDVETTVVEVDVGAANLGVERSEKRGAGFEVGAWDVADFEGPAGASHDGGERHDTNIERGGGKQRTSLAATAVSRLPAGRRRRP